MKGISKYCITNFLKQFFNSIKNVWYFDWSNYLAVKCKYQGGNLLKYIY